MMNKNEFYELLDNKLYELYGDSPELFIKERYNQEIQILKNSENETRFIERYSLVKPLIDKQIPFWFMGVTGCSFIAYLLGLTAVNPLKPHYYCKKCKTVEASSLRVDGFDLPIKTVHAAVKRWLMMGIIYIMN